MSLAARQRNRFALAIIATIATAWLSTNLRGDPLPAKPEPATPCRNWHTWSNGVIARAEAFATSLPKDGEPPDIEREKQHHVEQIYRSYLSAACRAEASYPWDRARAVLTKLDAHESWLTMLDSAQRAASQDDPAALAVLGVTEVPRRTGEELLVARLRENRGIRFSPGFVPNLRAGEPFADAQAQIAAKWIITQSGVGDPRRYPMIVFECVLNDMLSHDEQVSSRAAAVAGAALADLGSPPLTEWYLLDWTTRLMTCVSIERMFALVSTIASPLPPVALQRTQLDMLLRGKLTLAQWNQWRAAAPKPDDTAPILTPEALYAHIRRLIPSELSIGIRQAWSEFCFERYDGALGTLRTGDSSRESVSLYKWLCIRAYNTQQHDLLASIADSINTLPPDQAAEVCKHLAVQLHLDREEDVVTSLEQRIPRLLKARNDVGLLNHQLEEADYWLFQNDLPPVDQRHPQPAR